ncbi:FAD-binding oxidoreductase [Buchnera aphidicola]|uniref:FAD-binding oxidoreductase n=1 Tax=Buchnera aphidicola TaxID=9 RepID=UPI0022384CA1|nr:FAD-binding oxidoreductase [Buchnera aphidicola]MCW5197438.1 ferredoxin--NADP(+) reductase [Buchnera aphidicola (Chaitophorus viminalis)]
MTLWVKAQITQIQLWKKNLLYISLKASIDKFIAGQFSKIRIENPYTNTKIQRAYSFVNPPTSNKIEFFITLIKKGQMSQKLLQLKKKQNILISKKSYGFFTLKEILPSKILWMFSTGTAIGPYLSILQEKKDTKKFEKIILVHSVRYFSDLKYLHFIQNIKKIYQKKLIVIITISRERKKNFYYGRIQKLLLNNTLEKNISINMNKENSNIMLCGNPNMVEDLFKILVKKKNMTKNLRKKPGNITRENYW